MKKFYQQLDWYIPVVVDFIMNTNLHINIIINLQTQKQILSSSDYKVTSYLNLWIKSAFCSNHLSSNSDLRGYRTRTMYDYLQVLSN
jgi:hypothetical protein